MRTIKSEVKRYEISNEISDGYHTMGELYEHRTALFIALCREIAWNPEYQTEEQVWRSKLHSDGKGFKGWFILGINVKDGEQITYHLPISKWADTYFARTLDKCPEWDGHTSKDVLDRLKNL